jgi:hypothetical protein
MSLKELKKAIDKLYNKYGDVDCILNIIPEDDLYIIDGNDDKFVISKQEELFERCNKIKFNKENNIVILTN